MQGSILFSNLVNPISANIRGQTIKKGCLIISNPLTNKKEHEELGKHTTN